MDNSKDASAKNINNAWESIKGSTTQGCTGGASLGIGGQVCPSCGRCPTCGRGGWHYPQVWYSTPQVYGGMTATYGSFQCKATNE